METVFCRNCGTQIDSQASFCPKCGGRQAAGSVPPHAGAAYAGAVPPNEGAVLDYAGYSARSRLAAALLCFFLGVLGVHRFYVGKTGSGILMLCTAWLTLGIWPLIDFILIVCGSFKDEGGLLLIKW